MKVPFFEVVGKAYDDFEGADLIGAYAPIEPCLILRNAHLAKLVLIENFNDFVDNGFEAKKSLDPGLGYNPFSLPGQEWKEVRSIHTSVFTTTKVKAMTDDIAVCAKFLKNFIENEKHDVINMTSLAKIYLIDAVSKCAYGVESNVWTDPDPLLKNLIKNGVITSEIESNFAALCSILMPWANYITRTRMISHEALSYMQRIYESVVKQRSRQENPRNDLIQHLLRTDEKRKAAGKEGFTKLTWTTNLMVFFLNGTETASIAMSYAVYCLATHPEVQDKLRDEIRKMGVTLENLDFEKLKSLTYLDMVLSESLRLYPPLPVISRKAVKDTTLGSVRVPKGMKVLVPAWKLQKDSRNYSNPEEFDPERFSADRKSSIPKGAYLPFGEGPRLCIGMKFATTAIKIALVAMMLNYELSCPSHVDGLKPHVTSTLFLFPENGLVEVKFSPLAE
uniref:CYP4016A1 n=1 Tax=Apolygus lucorum TaxID=248454 RepID=A0A0U2DBC5_APOLU|nr:CYP4016A1 [Apolygus lucorum]